ncbi:MAG: NTP transferase domain-containing protein [Actinomycetes bacterium]
MSGPVLVILAAGRARRFGGIKPLAPIGLHGEAVIDLIASDAVAAGFGHIVVVINPDTGPVIRDHIAANWPSKVSVGFATQERPLGTVHAVLSAASELDDAVPFGVCNADDLYGRDAMLALGTHLTTAANNCLVGFRLDQALVGDQPVTRGVCQVQGGLLSGIAERRQVSLTPDGFRAGDGLEPVQLSPDNLVSMNLWGFVPSMWAVFQSAMNAAEASEEAEVLLPEIVGQELATGRSTFAVIPATSQCVGVTHPDDLAIVQEEIRKQVASGLRPEHAFH